MKQELGRFSDRPLGQRREAKFERRGLYAAHFPQQQADTADPRRLIAPRIVKSDIKHPLRNRHFMHKLFPHQVR